MKSCLAALVAGLLLVAVHVPAAADDQTACAAKAEQAGKKVFKRCATCHKIKDGKNGIGPHLYGIVDRAIAAADGFSYSRAMTSYAEVNADDDTPALWSLERLDAFIKAPKSEVRGTKMIFPGIKGKKPGDKRETQRANLLCYLQTIGADAS